ncbi:MAG TPA: hypothetical protein VFC82_08805 [Actinomycetaceae bacterium]|nr:hypothetical protein [Actinomycetaceae bacterium]
MTELHEQVTLPDPARKKLLHPTDLPEARRVYLRGWWFARLRSLPVIVAIGAVIWAATGSLFASLIAPISTFLIAFFASRELKKRAWDYVPRKRQSQNKNGALLVAGAVIDALALLVIAGSVIISLERWPLPAGVVSFAIGSAIGIAVLRFGQLLLAAGRRAEGASIAAHGILLTAVVIAIALVSAYGMPGGLAAVWHPVTAAGAATILLAQAVWWFFERGRKG